MLSRKGIIRKLADIKKLITESYNSEGVLVHRFSGEVKIEKPSEEEIVFYEQVQWKNESSLLINSKNIYRWTFLPSGNIRLEHLRFGKDNPVFLVELSMSEKNIWRSIEPHNCNNDLYSAELNMLNENPVLCWSVTGPTENYLLKIFYS